MKGIQGITAKAYFGSSPKMDFFVFEVVILFIPFIPVKTFWVLLFDFNDGGNHVGC